jgi:hypothetical protein
MTHNGVLLPVEMRDASSVEKDAYAATVKAGNARFITAWHALDDQARALGYSGIDELAEGSNR